MSFIRIKNIPKRSKKVSYPYAYLVENIWTSKGSRQKVLKYMGRIKGMKPLQRSIVEERYLKCASCGSLDDLTIDHITPLVVGGGNELSNLQRLCRKCNLKKGKVVHHDIALFKGVSDA